jgi:hypothetical protein
MKKLFIYISLIALVVSCSKEYSSDEYGGYEMMTDYMLSNYTQGAALRQISKVGEYQAASPGTSNMAWVMEPHDVESGALTQNVEMYIAYNGSFSGRASTSEILLRTFNRSDMYDGPVGLPRFETSLSLAEALAAMGLSEFGGGDIVEVRFQLNLTNGESYSRSSVTGSLTGSYFRSPFSYPLIIGCEQPAAEIAAQAGTYTIIGTDSYGDGWSTGESLTITVDGVVTRFGSYVPASGWDSTVANTGNEFSDGDDYTWTFTIKPGAQKMTIAWETGYYDDEVGFSISYTNPAGKSQSVVNSGAYPNGDEAAIRTSLPLSGMSICF